MRYEKNNIINKFSICLVLILMLMPLALANTEYNETGNTDAFYQTGTGFFNAQLTETSTFSRSVSVQRQTPLVSDLDGDGVNEIIIIDDDTVRLFRNKELDIVDAFDMGASQELSNMILFDIDGDNLTEIIVAQEESTEVIKIIQYNGTALTNQTDVNMAALTHSDGESIIKCRAVNDCLIVYNDKKSKSAEGGTAGDVYGAFFNTTAVTNEVNLDTIPAGTSMYCMPKIKHIALSDFDGDGDKDYIFTNVEVQSGGFNHVAIYYVDVTSNVPTEVLQVDDTEIVGTSDPGADCGSNHGKFFTSPLVAELDGSTGNFKETVIGTHTDDDEFNLKVYDSSGSLDEQHPLLADADGEIISNVMLADIFPDTDNVDYCVVGYQATTQKIDLLCGNNQGSTFVGQNELEFDLSIAGLHNVTTDFIKWNVIAHMGQHSTNIQEGKNINELINSYGVLEPDLSECSVLGLGADCTLNVLFDNPIDDSVLISVDAEKVNALGGREDLIALTSTNIFYIDDGFSNSGGAITSYSVNPCLDSTWKVNTSVTVTTIIEDNDTDTVSSKAILYRDQPNEQDSGFTGNVSSGTTNSFSFIANSTIGVGNLRLIGRDSENLDDLDTIDLTFSVGSTGVEFGDCITAVDVAAAAAAASEDEAALRETQLSDNAIRNAVNDIGDITNMGGQMVYIIMMLAVAIAVWFSPVAERQPNIAMGGMIVLEFLMITIGTILGILGIGLVVVFSVIGIGVIGLWLGARFTGVNNNNG